MATILVGTGLVGVQYQEVAVQTGRGSEERVRVAARLLLGVHTGLV